MSHNNIKQILLLMLLALIMVAIRTLPIYHLVFTSWPGDYGNYVNFSADDAVYHMRLVHNTIYHMPWRVFFDPFTHFPYGNQIHFGPLFTLIIAFASLIAGVGNLTPELINIVGAYTPVVMGALCLIPVYFIARFFCGQKAAIASAFILTFLPGEFLQRSSLGFTDHHVAEVLFSTVTCAFLIVALSMSRSIDFSFRGFITKDSSLFLKLGFFAGISFGLFILVWPAALMFGVIFLLFFIIQLTIDHLNDYKARYLLPLSIMLYVLPAIMVLPYALMNVKFELTYYSLTQPFALVAMLGLFLLCYVAHMLSKEHKIIKNLYSIILFAIFFVIVFFIYIYMPKFFLVIRDGCKLLFDPILGMRTVSEVWPSIINQNGNGFSLSRFWYAYIWAGPLSVIGLGNLFCRTYKDARPAEVFLFIWSLAIILAAVAQSRFNYYLAINVAILGGCYGVFLLLNLFSFLLSRYKFIQKIAKYIFLLLFVYLIIQPIFLMLKHHNSPSGIQIDWERYNTFIWLKRHTPDPQGKTVNKDFNYARGYYHIPKDPGARYNYPKSAYGVMAWWDVGHQITYIAERIPNSNPFQLGLVEGVNSIGAAAFFTSTDEEKAVANLDVLGSRYILIKREDVIDVGHRLGVWCDDVEGWIDFIKSKVGKQHDIKLPVDSEKFTDSVINKLFYDDAKDLRHFRLVYESDGRYSIFVRRAIFKPDFRTDTSYLEFEDYKYAVKNWDRINKTYWVDDGKSMLAYSARKPVKKIKIFEKVKGAIITGVVPASIKSGSEITLSLKLKSKFGRVFTYSQISQIKNAKYKFIVPYSTEQMRGEGYSYDISSIGKYSVIIGSKIVKVFVPEDAVMQGLTIDLDGSSDH